MLKTYHILGIILYFALVCPSCKRVTAEDIRDHISEDYRNTPAMNADSTVNMVVEIPAGTTAKYEMDKNAYTLKIDSIDGQPRYINYLGYPGNYGMIPNSMLSKEKGGDGDPLDILLLGVTEARGSMQMVRPIGVMKLLDNGEQDDKILAVPLTDKWSQVHSIADLDIHFLGAKEIVSIFFVNYKAKGEMVFEKWGDRSEAMSVIEMATND